MINALLNGALDLVIKVINIILTPIDILISNYLPDLNNGINYITQFFNLILSYIGWVFDSLMIPSDVISLICLYLIFKVTVSLLVYPVKLALKWYHYLKV